jgi:YidC/Oxa1 family membrane protein insertase
MLGTLWNNILFLPFLNLMMVLYHVLGSNFGFAVIAMAIITRLIMIPSTKKQMIMMKKMSGLRPALEKLQKKYGANQQKLAQEQMKLYKEVGYNPLGCLGNLLPQILILFVIIQVINVVNSNSFGDLYPFVKDFVFGGAKDLAINTHFFIIDLAKNYSEIAKEGGYFATEGIAYFVLAVLVGYIQYLSTKFMQTMQGTPAPKKKTKKDEQMSPEEMQAQMMGSMNLIFPVMTGFITLSAPAVLGVYWLAQSIMFIVQYFLIDREKATLALQGLFKKSN